jgi:hypothetical protein
VACGAAIMSFARAADNPVVRIAASRGVVSAPIWNLSNHASRYAFSVQMSVLFTYADQQRAAQNSQTEIATTGINNPAVIADQRVFLIGFGRWKNRWSRLHEILANIAAFIRFSPGGGNS